MGNKGIAIRNDTEFDLEIGLSLIKGSDLIKPGEWFIKDTSKVHMNIYC